MLGGFLLGTAWKNQDQSTEDTEQTAPVSEMETSEAAAEEDRQSFADLTSEPKPARLTSDEKAIIALFENAAPSTVFIATSEYQRNYWTMDISEIPRGNVGNEIRNLTKVPKSGSAKGGSPKCPSEGSQTPLPVRGSQLRDPF